MTCIIPSKKDSSNLQKLINFYISTLMHILLYNVYNYTDHFIFQFTAGWALPGASSSFRNFPAGHNNSRWMCNQTSIYLHQLVETPSVL